MRQLLLNAQRARAERLGKPVNDSGIALLLAMSWGLIFMMLAFGVVASVNNLTKNSGKSDNYYSAYAAAQAGIDDYIARLQLNPIYWQITDSTNGAFTGYVKVPGSATDETFTYTADTSTTGPSGQIILTSTGKSGNSIRRLRAILRRQSTIDYVLFSDYQTQDPQWPGAYSDTPSAMTLCANRYWYTAGKVGPGTASANGTTRNNNYCEWAEILSTEKFGGDSHTNDVWFFDGNIPSTVSAGIMSSSCPPPTCPAGHNWIDGSALSSPSFPETGVLSSNSIPATSGGISGTTTPGGSLNPIYTPILPLPSANVSLKADAAASGCIFTGPTRIKFMGDGTMQVTSPDTKSLAASPYCTILSGGSLKAGSPTSDPTVTISTVPNSAGYNGVIYVQSLPTLTTDPNYATSTKPATGTNTQAPTCAIKNTTTGGTKPFVIPSQESSLFAPSTGDYGGFPSAQDQSPTLPTAWFDCTQGDIYLQGALQGQVTLAAENNIGLTGSTYYADSYVTSGGSPVAVTDPNYGSVPNNSTNMLAVVPNNYLYNYNPINSAGNKVTDWLPYQPSTFPTTFDATKQGNVVYDFSAVAINHCFGTMNPNKGITNGGQIHLYGSIAQKYRCIVGIGSNGYSKNYTYDVRLRGASPPFFLDVSQGHWHRTLTTELTPQ